MSGRKAVTEVVGLSHIGLAQDLESYQVSSFKRVSFFKM